MWIATPEQHTSRGRWTPLRLLDKQIKATTSKNRTHAKTLGVRARDVQTKFIILIVVTIWNLYWGFWWKSRQWYCGVQQIDSTNHSTLHSAFASRVEESHFDEDGALRLSRYCTTTYQVNLFCTTVSALKARYSPNPPSNDLIQFLLGYGEAALRAPYTSL